jgi:signal transduction histidine kinase
VFRSARLKLTLLYTLAIAAIMAVFSVALYVAISTATTSTTEVPESVTPAVEQSILEAQLARARLALVGINAVGWVVAATASYVVAGRTLAPIERALSRQHQFTAHASHELRTPLTVIKGEIDVTRARDRSSEQYRQALDRIDAEVIHLNTMASDLLALARMEGMSEHTERRRKIVADVVAEVLDPLRATMRDRNIRVTPAVSPDLEATLDWNRVRHLLTNLLENAIQYTPAAGEIRIGATRVGKNVEFSVFNSGSFIEPEDMPHVFLPFYRGKASNPDTGTGLGLALCEWIAHVHGGTIQARNMADGVLFVARLPTD